MTVFCVGIYSSVYLSFLFLTPSPYLVQVFITVSICRFPSHLYRILCRHLQQWTSINLCSLHLYRILCRYLQQWASMFFFFFFFFFFSFFLLHLYRILFRYSQQWASFLNIFFTYTFGAFLLCRYVQECASVFFIFYYTFTVSCAGMYSSEHI